MLALVSLRHCVHCGRPVATRTCSDPATTVHRAQTFNADRKNKSFAISPTSCFQLAWLLAYLVFCAAVYDLQGPSAPCSKLANILVFISAPKFFLLHLLQGPCRAPKSFDEDTPSTKTKERQTSHGSSAHVRLRCPFKWST